MIIQKSSVVHLIGGLSSSADTLRHIPESGPAVKAILDNVEKLAKALLDSPVTEESLGSYSETTRS